MSNIFFIADTHFGHENIIRYCDRPFARAQEMDAKIIDNWNAVVRPGDTVYHLGDFSWSHPEPYLKRLMGKVVLIKGNHDRSRWIEESPFEGCHHLLELKNKPVKGASIVLCHYSMRVWNHSHRNGSWMLYGHDHGRLAPIKNSVDVGVDPNGFRPLALEEVARLIKKTQALVSYNEMPAEELEAQGMRP